MQAVVDSTYQDVLDYESIRRCDGSCRKVREGDNKNIVVSVICIVVTEADLTSSNIDLSGCSNADCSSMTRKRRFSFEKNEGLLADAMTVSNSVRHVSSPGRNGSSLSSSQRGHSRVRVASVMWSRRTSVRRRRRRRRVGVYGILVPIGRIVKIDLVFPVETAYAAGMIDPHYQPDRSLFAACSG